MKQYQITLVALANVSTRVDVEAENEKEAEARAIQYAKDGNVSWNYDGISSDESIEVGA